MPDIDTKIAEWRKRMAAEGIKDAAVLDELEAHLREEIQQRLTAGDLSAEAFEFAVARIGTPNSLRKEFNKISGATSLSVIIGTSIWAVLTILVAVMMTGRVFHGNMTLWLCAHIVILTAGYFALFVTGAFAIYFVCRQWRGKLSQAEQTALDRAISCFNRVALGLIAAGFILGMVWVGQNPGVSLRGHLREREWATVIVILWQLMAWAIERFNRRQNSLRMAAYIGGNVVGALAWFGIAYLDGDPGLRHFSDSWPLQIFIGFHLLVVALAFSRRFEAAKSQIN